MKTSYPNHHRRGLISLEFMTALMLLLATVLLFLGVTSKRIRVSKRLADERAAVRLAEQTMLTLRVNGYASATPIERVAITKLADPAPAAHVWVEVNATVEERKTSLVGLVPVKEAP